MKRRKSYEMSTTQADELDGLLMEKTICPVSAGAKSFDFDRWRFVGGSIADTDIGAASNVNAGRSQIVFAMRDAVSHLAKTLSP
jgi:hypothetical protein